MQVIQLSDADNGKTLRLTASDRLLIKLAANPTTGYIWEIQHNDHFKVSREYEAGSGGGMGNSGTDIFELIPLTPGKNGLITFLYRRSWEGREAERSFSVHYEIA